MTRTAAVLLAAGASTRLGVPKQLVAFHGRPLVVHAIDRLRRAGARPIVVVLGRAADDVRRAVADADHHEDVTFVVNEAWADGQGTSVATGIRAVRALADVDAALIHVCDQPFMTADHLDRLRTLVANGDADIAATSYDDGRGGVPACFARAVFDDLASLDGDRGARNILRDERRRDRTVLVAPPHAPGDVDTPADLAALRNAERDLR